MLIFLEKKSKRLIFEFHKFGVDNEESSDKKNCESSNLITNANIKSAIY